MDKNFLKIKNFHCSEHGYIAPEPHCPKCQKTTPERTCPSEPTEQKSWEGKFRNNFAAHDGKRMVVHGGYESVIAFIAAEIERAREEERSKLSERITDAIRDTQDIQDISARLFTIITQTLSAPVEK